MAKNDTRRARFVAEYCVDLNATAAAIRAGYSARSARAIGSQLLAAPGIKDAIARQEKARCARLTLDADNLLSFVMRIAVADPADLVRPDGTARDLDEIDPETRALLVASTTVDQAGRRVVKLRQHDKLLAVDTLLRHLKLAHARTEARSERGEDPASDSGGGLAEAMRLAEERIK